MTPTQKAQTIKKLHVVALGGMGQYKDDAVGYLTKVLKIELTPEQVRIAEAASSESRIAVPAGFAVGKSFLVGALANWRYDTRSESIVYITSVSWHQALHRCFKQAKMQRREAKLPGQIMQTGWIRDTDVAKRDVHFIKALNAEKQEGLTGEHVAPMAFFVEEADGAEPFIQNALENAMAGEDCFAMLIGNPVNPSSWFAAACSSKAYFCVHINVLEHPNILAELKGDPAPFPKAVRLKWVRDQMAVHCNPAAQEDPDAFEFPKETGLWYLPDAYFQSSVIGIFPTIGETSVIPARFVNAATENPLKWADGSDYRPTGPKIAGWDVADSVSGGALNALYIRQGPKTLYLNAFASQVEQATWKVIDIAQDHECRVLNYDAQGPGAKVGDVVAAGPPDWFVEKWGEVRIQLNPVNGGAPVPEDITLPDERRACQVYLNQRSYTYYHLAGGAFRKTFENSQVAKYPIDETIQIPRNAVLGEQLPLTKVKRAEPKMVLTSKLDFRQQGLPSPDHADALVLTYAEYTPLFLPTGISGHVGKDPFDA